MARHEKIDPEIDKLITKLTRSRGSLEGYADELEKMLTDVRKIFPEGNDFRNKYLLDDKLKTTSTFFSAALSVRKEINDTLIKEIELRRKVTKDEDAQKEMSAAEVRKLIDLIDKDALNRRRQAEHDLQEVDVLDKREEEHIIGLDKFASDNDIDLGTSSSEVNSDKEKVNPVPEVENVTVIIDNEPEIDNG